MDSPSPGGTLALDPLCCVQTAQGHRARPPDHPGRRRSCQEQPPLPELPSPVRLAFPQLPSPPRFMQIQLLDCCLMSNTGG